MPDYLKPIQTMPSLNEFINHDLSINKVLIVSGKKNSTPEFKAIASEFKDKILFAFADSDAVDLHAELKVARKPEVIVYRTYDVDLNQVAEQVSRTDFNETYISVPLLKAFLE